MSSEVRQVRTAWMATLAKIQASADVAMISADDWSIGKDARLERYLSLNCPSLTLWSRAPGGD
jgi:hypothetical protein